MLFFIYNSLFFIDHHLFLISYHLFFVDYHLLFIDHRLLFIKYLLFFIDYCIFFIIYFYSLSIQSFSSYHEMKFYYRQCNRGPVVKARIGNLKGLRLSHPAHTLNFFHRLIVRKIPVGEKMQENFGSWRSNHFPLPWPMSPAPSGQGGGILRKALCCGPYIGGPGVDSCAQSSLPARQAFCSSALTVLRGLAFMNLFP